jgi:hypothetical protein
MSPGRSPIGVVAAAGVAVAGLVAIAAWQLEARDPAPPRAALTLASGAREERPSRATAQARPGGDGPAEESVPREVVRRMARQMEERRASVCGVLHVDARDELSVDGARVEVPADGTVVVRVPVGARRRSVAVVVRPAGGGRVRREVPCRGSEEAGAEELEIRWERR